MVIRITLSWMIQQFDIYINHSQAIWGHIHVIVVKIVTILIHYSTNHCDTANLVATIGNQ